jgi:hypothetical protein
MHTSVDKDVEVPVLVSSHNHRDQAYIRCLVVARFGHFALVSDVVPCAIKDAPYLFVEDLRIGVYRGMNTSQVGPNQFIDVRGG